MLDWAKARYPSKELDTRSIITPLTRIETIGSYHIFQMSNGEHVVIFSNQATLLKYVEANLGSIFMIGLLKEDNTKYSYSVNLDKDIKLKVLTVARAVVMVQGDTDNPRELRYNSDELVMVE